MFQAGIIGIGHLAAYIRYEKIAELRIDNLIRNSLNVLWEGPIFKRLLSGIDVCIQSVYKSIPGDIDTLAQHWYRSVAAEWVFSLCRLLLRIQNYHHGGALLLTPDITFAGLSLKYRVQYDRLRTALENRALLRIQHRFTSNKIRSIYKDYQNDIPPLLYLDEKVYEARLDDNRIELDGTIWFISLLSRVDGLVLMTPNLEVRAFGVEILVNERPDQVYLAGDSNATKKKLRSIEYEHYGTRHRSMMRYCAMVPESVGFVVSQDGDVRVMTVVKDELVVWENIRLQLHDFVRRSSRTIKGLKPTDGT